MRTFLTGVPRTGYVAVSGPLLARTGILSLIRQGHLDKLIVFTLPMFLLKKANQKIAQVVIPLVIANEVGVSPDDVTDYVNRRGVELSIPEPARTLIKFDEERMMSFLAKICGVRCCRFRKRGVPQAEAR